MWTFFVALLLCVFVLGSPTALAQQPRTLGERCLQKAGGTFDRNTGMWRRVKSKVVYKACLAGRDPRTPLKPPR